MDAEGGFWQGLQPCTRNVNVTVNVSIKSWQPVGWRGGVGWQDTP